jgi:hypothetical protein
MKRQNEPLMVFSMEEWIRLTGSFIQKARIGDKVAAVTGALGIKPCDGCKERQAYLNGERSPDN